MRNQYKLLAEVYERADEAQGSSLEVKKQTRQRVIDIGGVKRQRGSREVPSIMFISDTIDGCGAVPRFVAEGEGSGLLIYCFRDSSNDEYCIGNGDSDRDDEWISCTEKEFITELNCIEAKIAEQKAIKRSFDDGTKSSGLDLNIEASGQIKRNSPRDIRARLIKVGGIVNPAEVVCDTEGNETLVGNEEIVLKSKLFDSNGTVLMISYYPQEHTIRNQYWTGTCPGIFCTDMEVTSRKDFVKEMERFEQYYAELKKGKDATGLDLNIENGNVKRKV